MALMVDGYIYCDTHEGTMSVPQEEKLQDGWIKHGEYYFCPQCWGMYKRVDEMMHRVEKAGEHVANKKAKK